MEEYGIMEYLELAVTRCGRWTGNREFIWSGLIIINNKNPNWKNQIMRIIFFFSWGNQHPLPPPLALDVEVLDKNWTEIEGSNLNNMGEGT